MKFSLLCLALFSAALVSAKPSQSHNDVKDYQSEVLKLYEGLGTEDTHDFVRHEFPFYDAKYYTEPKVVEKFMVAFKDGFLDKEGYFNLYSYKNRHDTYRLFDLFYFAKDFETFAKLAKWAKKELNPLQFVYALTAAVYHRKDTMGVIPPPFYEVLPTYFVPSDVMDQTYKSMMHDVKFRKFEVNSTGHEYSWYQDQTYDVYKYGPKFNEFDTETRVSYFREDVDLNDWYSKFFLQMSPWLSDEKYPDITFGRRGEYMYNIFHNILNRYNLERYGNGLPPVEPIDFSKPIETGYNPHLINIGGRPLLPRPDGLVPSYTNPTGVSYLESMYNRYLGEVDSQAMYNPFNNTGISLEGVEGFEFLSKVFFGASHPMLRRYFRPLYFQALETLDMAVKSSNDIGFSGAPVGNFLTEMRDPAFYQVLAYLDRIFRMYNSKKTPYTQQDLEFPGVKINSLDFSKWETYFERYEFDISNGVPSKGGKHKYLASKFRLNCKPFTYKINVQSDKQTKVIVKTWIAPKSDADFRLLGVEGFLKYGTGFDWFIADVKPGMNTIERKSSSFSFFKETPRIKHILEKVQRANEKNEPFHPTIDYLEAAPANVALPRGSKSGTDYQIAVYITPENGHYMEDKNNFGFPSTDDKRFFMEPFDRPSGHHAFQIDNMYFDDVTIYDITKYSTL